MDQIVRIAVGKDWMNWYKRVIEALEYFQSLGVSLSFDELNIDTTNWQDKIDPYDVIIWNPTYMEGLSKHFKEKIYFMQFFLNKLVIPNFNTIWHFDSKVAESYLFKKYGINSPRTIATFDYTDARQLIETFDMPIVMKRSEGAASRYVKLIQNQQKALAQFDRLFCDKIWGEARRDTTKMKFFLKYFTKRWFWNRIFWRFGLNHGADGVAYWQEFIAGNSADLRITTIGDRYAYGFWRNNRPNDFRASGSGLIDYHREVPIDLIHYCLGINQRLGFDSMAYDILFKGDSFFINEMSYNYVDKALYNAPGYYERLEDHSLVFHEGHYWPELFWVKWALSKVEIVD